MPALFTAKRTLISAAANAVFAVVLGALGAHALKPRLEVALFGAYQTAVQYHFFHALALLALAALMLHVGGTRALRLAALLFNAGIVLFSGSLYALALGGPSGLGPLTPLGGLCFIGGWLSLLVAALRMPSREQ